MEIEPLDLDNQSDDRNTLHCDIQTLTSMLIGYKRPTDLHRYGRIQADSRTVAALERVIPRTKTYLSDYF
jgi:predicted acetyltransferase